MDDRVYRFRLGVVVAAAAAILVLLIMLMGDLPRPLTSRYDIYVDFPNAPGVDEGTPARKSGITIGRVKEVRFLENDRGVQLTIQIDGQRRIYDDESVRIASASLLGDAVVEFYRPDNSPPQGQRVMPGDIMVGAVSQGPAEVITNLEPDLKRTIIAIERAAADVQRLTAALNNVIGENQDQIPRILAKTERSLDQFNLTMTSMQDIFGDAELRSKIHSSLENLPTALEEARSTFAQVREGFEGFERVTQQAEQNLANLSKFTTPLGERGPAMAANIDGSIAKLDAVLEQLVEFSENLNSREGTLGQLLNDREIYDSLARTVANAEDITRKFRPIMGDLRVASSKIATDPRLLGVKGALDKRPSGAGSKGLFMDYEYPAVGYDLYQE